MKRFDFRLQSVLVLRQRLLGEAEARYARAIQAVHAIVERIRQEQDRMVALSHAVMELQKQGNRIAGIQQESLYSSLRHAESVGKSLERMLREAKIVEGRERLAYIEARRDFELLEKLKERQRHHHIQLALADEQRELDDMFNARRTMGTVGSQS
jgi:flagellar export protein FliJ